MNALSFIGGLIFGAVLTVIGIICYIGWLSADDHTLNGDPERDAGMQESSMLEPFSPAQLRGTVAGLACIAAPNIIAAVLTWILA